MFQAVVIVAGILAMVVLHALPFLTEALFVFLIVRALICKEDHL